LSKKHLWILVVNNPAGKKKVKAGKYSCKYISYQSLLLKVIEFRFLPAENNLPQLENVRQKENR